MAFGGIIEDDGDGDVSVSSSAMRRPLPENIDSSASVFSQTAPSLVESEKSDAHMLPGVDVTGLSSRLETGEGTAHIAKKAKVADSVTREPVQLSQLNRMISDAQSHVAETSLKLPWELPCFESIFYEPAPKLPKVVNTLSSYENPAYDKSSGSVNISGNIERAEVKPVLFESAVSFKQGRTRALSYIAQFDLLTQRWECVVSINFSATSIGDNLRARDRPARLLYVSECLGGKSLATVRKRLGQVVRYLKWGEKNTFQCPLPFTTELVHDYIKTIIFEGSGFSSVNGFMECIRFMHYTLGFIAPHGLLQDPWIVGKLRKLKQERPLRRQSRTLTVRELRHIEELLFDSTRSIVDRYAAGCILFGTYSRSRVADMACIGQYIVDIQSMDRGNVGYLEMHTSSHKMRATSNALGLNLALVAPIRGLGPLEWGVQFVEVAKQAGLDFGKRKTKEPLLPAPCLEGGWSNRPIGSKEVKLWLHAMLSDLTDFSCENLTGHCIKATTLSMLARYGASDEVRMVLGHHSMRGKSSLEAYSRDIQAYPLRVLEQMFHSIRLGTFCPDNTRSGVMKGVDKSHAEHLDVDNVGTDAKHPKHLTPVEQEVSDEHYFPTGAFSGSSLRDEPLDLRQGGLDDSLVDGALGLNFEDWEQVGTGDEKENEVVKSSFGDESDSDSSSSSSGDSGTSDDEVLVRTATDLGPQVEWKPGCVVYQNRKTKTLHLLPIGSSDLFLCGRKFGRDTAIFQGGIQSLEWRCKQCDRGKPIRHVEGMVDAFDAALKRVKNK